MRIYKNEIKTRKTENAGTDHCNPSTKKVVTATAMIKTIPAKVNKGWARKRIGKRNNRSRVRAFRNRRCVLRITSQTNSIPATAAPYNMRKAFFGAKMAKRMAAIIPPVEARSARCWTPLRLTFPIHRGT